MPSESSMIFSIHLPRGVVFVGVFETADVRFRMSNTFLFIAISPFRFFDGW